MRKHRLTWAITIPLSAAVAGVWVWNLQTTLKSVGGTGGLGDIVPTVQNAAGAVTKGYADIHDEIQAASDALDPKAKEAAAMDLLKQKVEAAAASKPIAPAPNHLEPAVDTSKGNKR